MSEPHSGSKEELFYVLLLTDLDTVHTRACEQVPHTQHPVLTGAARCHRVVSVDEDGGDGPGVAVQGVHAGPVIRPDHLQSVVSAASHQPPVLERQATGNNQNVN